jgi:hypothetical protein
MQPIQASINLENIFKKKALLPFFFLKTNLIEII